MQYVLSLRTDPETGNREYCVLREDTGKPVPGGKYTARSEALRHLQALAIVTSREGKGLQKLSEREMVVARYTIAGLERKLVAQELFLSEGTVRTHLQNVYKKLHVDSRSSLIIKMLLLGFIHLNDLPELAVLADRVRKSSH